FIGKCLDAIIVNDFPKNKLEVFVVDGMSDDGTRQLISDYTKKFPFIKLLSNEKKVTPVAMNMGIKAAKGEYIIILSSHSEIDHRFLSLNLEGFEKYAADCVGGIIITLPANKTIIAESVALALAHPFGVGNSHFRIGATEPKYVDTVPFGCYKKERIESIGLFDEDLVRNQDDELNLRLLKHGGKILLMPNIISFYHARESLQKLWKMYYQYGHFKPLVAHKVGGVLTWRQLIPALFVSNLIVLGMFSFISHYFFGLFLGVVLLYIMGNLFFAFSVAKRKGLKFFMTLPAVFATLHFSYGTGYIKGIWDFIIIKKQNRNNIGDIPSSR
ncbi:MAG: glycosyltransferase family 2 protein, partial [Leadbetterella sp.]|nr:glycosyltransferase family 2 protein [Leadbetterella sp.]